MRASQKRTLGRGFVAGLVGSAAVIAFFVVTSLLAGRSPLVLPSDLGAALLPGVDGAGGGVEPMAVLAFSGFHAVASIAAGVLTAWLIQEALDHSELWYVVVFVLMGGFLAVLLGMGVLGSELAGAVSWGAVFAANTLWAAAVGATLYGAHRSGPLGGVARSAGTSR